MTLLKWPNFNTISKVLGPGVMFAGTAIGVSHLVQSTGAGARFGFTLMWAVVAANVFKYPFFEFGSRYANATGRSLIHGYKEMGKGAFELYLLITVGTMFFVSAAVGIVTAGFLSNLLSGAGIAEMSVFQTALGLFIVTPVFLISGKFKWLLKVLKWTGLLLLICTLAVFFITMARTNVEYSEIFVPFEHSPANVAFLLALMGWMPTAVDLSVWNSIWTLERIRETGYRPSLKQTSNEFKFGYWISAILALVFVYLGAVVFLPSGIQLPSNAGEFAGRVVSVFSESFGPGSYVLMAIAAFCIMLGTFIAVFDGFGRALSISAGLIGNEKHDSNNKRATNIYTGIVVLLSLGSFELLYFMIFRSPDSTGFRFMVDLATTLSFLVAPVIAVFNYRLVTSKSFPVESRPGLWLKLQSLLGILFLAGFALYYLWV